jgi:hypothetical protein
MLTIPHPFRGWGQKIGWQIRYTFLHLILIMMVTKANTGFYFSYYFRIVRDAFVKN